jgi:hypothetical protein
METRPPHNAGPEHFCGHCRPKFDLERLFVRCVAHGIVKTASFDYLLGVLYGDL